MVEKPCPKYTYVGLTLANFGKFLQYREKHVA